MIAIGTASCDGYLPSASTQSIELVKVSGGGKDVTIVTETDRYDSLVVKVIDRDGRPVSGVEVTWTQTDPEGEMEPAVSTTGPNGTAWSKWTVSGLPTTYRASAILADHGTQDFALTVRSWDAKDVEWRCALSATGELACAGADGARLQTLMPAKRFVSLTAFNKSSSQAPPSSICALDTLGTVWCAPRTAGLPSFTEFNAGQPPLREFRAQGDTYCGVSFDDQLWCWGSSRFGLRGDGVGDGSITYDPIAKRVSAAGMNAVTALDMGGNFACVVDVNGVPWCWGRNAEGVVSPDPALQYQTLTPRRVETPEPVRHLSLAGEDTACAIATSGRILCWGDELFSGRAVNAGGGVAAYIDSGDWFGALTEVISGFIGTTRDGNVEYWGSLWYGHFAFIRTPVKLPLPEGVGVAAILTQRHSSNHATCLRTRNGGGTVCMGLASSMWYRTPSRWFGILPPLAATSL